MLVSHCRGTDGLVVLVLHRSQGKIEILAFLCNRLKNFRILLNIGRSPHNQGDVNRFGNLFYNFGCFFTACVFAVGVGAFQLKHNKLGPVVLDTFFRPRGRIGYYILERCQSRLGPLFRLHVPDLHGDLRLVGHFALEQVEGITCLAPHLNGFFPFAECNLLYAAGIRLFCNFKSHSYLLRKNFNRFRAAVQATGTMDVSTTACLGSKSGVP